MAEYEASTIELIQLSTKNRPTPGADRSKYRRYHRVTSHNIENCSTLKDKIEKLIQKGYLQKIVKHPSHDKDYEREIKSKNTIRLTRQ